ncbi:MAG: hypothetical protein IPK88_00580 [Saprospiraceae bacterium]|nr:hypothetical protein [Candidatus Defluviibacterium haderslevense]
MKNNNSTQIISESILEYVKSESQFALMINGEWGSGKSYYFKEVLSNVLKGFTQKKIIYTSANGISSFNEILEQIITKKYYSNKKSIQKGLNLTYQLSKLALKESDRYRIIGNMLDVIPKIFNSKDIDGFKNDIIIIDDIERINFNKFPIDDFFGVINKIFTEHDSISVILICDEAQLKVKLGKDDLIFKYEIIKEKSILRTIKFKQDILDLLPSIINESNFNRDKNKYILENLDFIKELITFTNEKNLRTIKFFFNNLATFTNLIDPQKFERISKYIILFNFICSKAFKDGKLDKFDDKIKDFSNEIEFIGMRPIFSTSGRIDVENGIDETLPYREIAIKFSNYFKMFFSISDYIKTGYLDATFLHSEIDKYLPQLNHLDEWNIKLDKLNNFRNLSIPEFKDTVKSIFIFLQQNKYDIDSILKFANKYFFFLEDNVKLNNFESDEFKTFICNCLNKAIENEIYTSIFPEERLEKYKHKFADAKEILNCYMDIYKMKINSYIENSILTLKVKLIDNLKEFNQSDFWILFSKIEIQEIDGFLTKYLGDSLFAGMFNLKLNNEWNFIKQSENKIDPMENVFQFITKLKEIDIEKDSPIPYYVEDLNRILNNKRNFEIN